jgi:MinD superfamily P-loop ATPase
MKIAVLSGKGGTGKTLVSVNMASASKRSVYVDCDVEEPNGYLYFKPEELEIENITLSIPVVNQARCNGCQKCVEFCNFNALAYTGKKLIVFDEVCHACGGCVMVCPEKALSERQRVIGEVKVGKTGDTWVLTGMLNPGEVSGVPIINRLLEKEKAYENKGLTIIDCPPGSACSVMESIKEADYCLLVAEPTIFGSQNLQMVHELVQLFQKPHGVVLNKCLDDENPSEQYCLDKGVHILGRIPFDREIGRLNSNAQILVNENTTYKAMFDSLIARIRKEVVK